MLTVECLLFASYVAIKLWFPTLASEIMPKYEESKYRMVESVKELKRDEDQPVGVFANYVYDISSLVKNHPAGYKIVEGIKHRDFDRYLYGMYRSEREPRIPEHVHGYKVLTMVGEPIAKIKIPQLYKNLERDYGEVAINRITTISERGSIYHLELESA